MIGSNATVTVEHLTQTRDTHGGKVDGAPDTTIVAEAMIERTTAQGNLWRMTVGADLSALGEGPGEWKITDTLGRVFAPVKVSYRPPIVQIGESEHSLVFAELRGEVDLGVV